MRNRSEMNMEDGKTEAGRMEEKMEDGVMIGEWKMVIPGIIMDRNSMAPLQSYGKKYKRTVLPILMTDIPNTLSMKTALPIASPIIPGKSWKVLRALYPIMSGM